MDIKDQIQYIHQHNKDEGAKIFNENDMEHVWSGVQDVLKQSAFLNIEKKFRYNSCENFKPGS